MYIYSSENIQFDVLYKITATKMNIKVIQSYIIIRKHDTDSC